MLKYKVVQIWPGLIVCQQVTVCPGHIWTTLYLPIYVDKWNFLFILLVIMLIYIQVLYGRCTILRFVGGDFKSLSTSFPLCLRSNYTLILPSTTQLIARKKATGSACQHQAIIRPNTLKIISKNCYETSYLYSNIFVTHVQSLTKTKQPIYKINWKHFT